MNPRHGKSIWNDNNSDEEDGLAIFHVSLTAGHNLHEPILIAAEQKRRIKNSLGVSSGRANN